MELSNPGCLAGQGDTGSPVGNVNANELLRAVIRLQEGRYYMLV